MASTSTASEFSFAPGHVDIDIAGGSSKQAVASAKETMGTPSSSQFASFDGFEVAAGSQENRAKAEKIMNTEAGIRLQTEQAPAQKGDAQRIDLNKKDDFSFAKFDGFEVAHASTKFAEVGAKALMSEMNSPSFVAALADNAAKAPASTTTLGGGAGFQIG